MAKPQVSSGCRGLFPVLAWAAFARFGRRALRANPCSGCQQGGTAFPEPGSPAGKELHTHPSISLITSVLSEKICFSGTSCLPDFLGPHFSCFGRALSWNHAPPCRTKCLARQLNHKALIHSISVLVNILAEPQASLHQNQMVLPTLPTCLKSRGQKVFIELSWKCPKLFPNCSLTQY